MNGRLIGKVSDAGKDWGQKEKRALEDKMAGWYHRCNGHELGQTLGDGEGQGGLACCSRCGRKESGTTGPLNNNNNNRINKQRHKWPQMTKNTDHKELVQGGHRTKK